MEKQKTNLKVLKADEVGPEIIAKSIEDISSAMKKVSGTRLTRDALVTLIYAKSKVNKRDIEFVLNNLEQLEEIWLKKKN